MMTNHTDTKPAHIIELYLSPTMYPSPSTAAPVFILNTVLALSAISAPRGITLVDNTSLHHPKVDRTKSYSPPTIPAKMSGRAWLPPFSPEMSTCVVAVASGKGYFPCICDTKYLRKGIRSSMPSMPPSRELKNTSRKFTVSSGLVLWRM